MRITMIMALVVLFSSSLSAASEVFLFSDPSGLAASVTFTQIDATTLEVRARNTSTGVPGGFESSDQILTTVSWDFSLPGNNASDPQIIGGNVKTGSASASVNFATSVGPNADVSGEWGFGNNGGSGSILNSISSTAAQVTSFGGANLDGPAGLDGPQGGLVANPVLVAIGGLGALQDEIVATLTLDKPLANLDFLEANLVRVEFGSDRTFITIPEPATAGLLAIGLFGLLRRRKRGKVASPMNMRVHR